MDFRAMLMKRKKPPKKVVVVSQSGNCKNPLQFIINSIQHVFSLPEKTINTVLYFVFRC